VADALGDVGPRIALTRFAAEMTRESALLWRPIKVFRRQDVTLQDQRIIVVAAEAAGGQIFG
jgi:hypothetical protein